MKDTASVMADSLSTSGASGGRLLLDAADVDVTIERCAGPHHDT
jgi:hypothetical protein